MPITIEGLRLRDEVKPERWVVLLSYVAKFFQVPLVVLGYVLKLAWNAFQFGWSRA